MGLNQPSDVEGLADEHSDRIVVKISSAQKTEHQAAIGEKKRATLPVVEAEAVRVLNHRSPSAF